jgi:hypothetical protein
MDANTKQRALRAAARLAMGVSFAGCGGIADVVPPPTDASGVDTKADSTTAQGDAQPPPPDSSYVDVGSCDLNAKDADGGLTTAAVTCCLQLTEASSSGIDAGEFVTDPSLSGCCQALYDMGNNNLVTYVYGPDKWPQATCQACADAINHSIACTPWGPPVPPAMLEVV